MTVTVGSYEAKTHLPRLLDEVVAAGTIFTITKHGTPVAQLVPIQRGFRDNAAAVDAFRAARTGLQLNGLNIREMIEEGRR